MNDFMTKTSKSLSRLFRRAKEVGDDAAEVTGTKLHEMRLATGIRRLPGERETLLKQIGTKVYTLHTRGKVRNRDVDTDCVKIDDLNTQIRDLRKQIEEIQRRRSGLDLEVADLADETPVADGDEGEAQAIATPGPAHAGTPGEEPEPDTQPMPEPKGCDEEEPDKPAAS